MPDLEIPNSIDQDTVADAVEVDENFDRIELFINNDLINRDGTVAMTGQLQLVGDPTSDQNAATKAYVDALMPIGVMMPYGGNSAPEGGWLLCDGSSKSTATYPLLFSALQYRYGGSGGSFNLPNMAGRVPVGVDSEQTRFNTTGKSGGNTLVPIPSHFHAITHDHAEFDSGDESAHHYHDIDHNHASFNTAASLGGHEHQVRFLNVYNPGPGDGAAVYSAHVNWTSPTISGTTLINGTEDGEHPHAVDIPNSVGLNSLAETTHHRHPVNVPNFTGDSAAKSLSVDLLLKTAGTAVAPAVTTTTEHIAPFVVVNYIIKADNV